MIRQALLVLCGSFLAVVLWSSAHLSPAFDETGHLAFSVLRLTGAYDTLPPDAWWTGRDPLSPPVTVLSAVPALAAGRTPQHIARTQHPTPLQILVARWPVHLAGAGILLLIFAIGRRLFGPEGGLASAAVLAASPLFVGSSTILSTDLYGALGATAVLAVLVRFATGPLTPTAGQTVLHSLLLAGALAFAIVAKVSNLLWFGIAGLTLLLLLLRDRGAEGGLRHWMVVGSAGLGGGLLLGLVFYEIFSPEFPPALILGREIRLPLGHGLLAAADATGHLRSVHNLLWFRDGIVPAGPQHYLAGFLLFTPLPLILLYGCGLAAAVFVLTRGVVPARLVLAALLLLTLVWTVFFATRGVYIGFRHMLVSVVLVSILCGAIAPAVRTLGSRAACIAAAAAGLLLGASLTVCALSSPWQSLFRNSLLRGELIFAGPDVDWGQGLYDMARWQREELGGEEILLSWMGGGRPEHYGVRYRGLPAILTAGTVDVEIASQDPTPENLRGHVVVISRSHLGGQYFRLAGLTTEFYADWRDIPPDAVIGGGSLLVYDLRE